jgi:nanoRNase/pAp phosphatase (c-di-AMP/oligoRNAs hydrolase)
MLPSGPVPLAASTVAALVLVAAGGYAVRTGVTRMGTPDELTQLRRSIRDADRVALIVPAHPDVDAIAAAVGLQALCEGWGIRADLRAPERPESDDVTAFCNLFDLDLGTLDGARADAAVAVGGGGSMPDLGALGPPAAVVRHRPAPVDGPEVLAPADAAATSTTVTALLQQSEVVPEGRVAAALLYGVRAGTGEFRSVRSGRDYEAARYLHDLADRGLLERLRAPGTSGETFDVIGAAITSRERHASVAVANAGSVPGISALEEAAGTLLRLDGVSTAAVFGTDDDAVVVACRTEEVRTNAADILDRAFEDGHTAGGPDTATTRVSLGPFTEVDADHEATLEGLVDVSVRDALAEAAEAA